LPIPDQADASLSIMRGVIWLCANYFRQSRCLLLLRSEIPSGMCAKLRTMAASNKRDHPTRSLYY